MKGLHLIFDGNNTSYRANAVTELYTKQGERTSAIIGTLNITHSTMINLTKELKMPIKEVIYAWDMGHSPRRMSVFPDYKGNRKKTFTPENAEWMKEFIHQANVLHENLPLFGIKSYRKKGWEGDDIVLGIVEEVTKEAPEDLSVIISTDEDFHQLISLSTAVYSPIKKILYTLDNYKELTGIDHENFLTYKILKGDSSDGIPGIPGIGEKTAKTLVNTYGSLETLLEASDELKKSKRTAKIFTQEGLSTLDINNRLINLREYVDLSEIHGDIVALLEEEPTIDEKAVKAFLMRYQLTSILVKFKSWIDTFSEAVDNFYGIPAYIYNNGTQE